MIKSGNRYFCGGCKTWQTLVEGEDSAKCPDCKFVNTTPADDKNKKDEDEENDG